MAQLRRRWQRLSAAARPVHHCSPADWHVVGDREPPRRPRPRLGVLLRLPCPLGPGPVPLIYLSRSYLSAHEIETPLL